MFDVRQVRAVATVQHVRKPYWFERFNWFATSEKCARALRGVPTLHFHPIV